MGEREKKEKEREREEREREKEKKTSWLFVKLPSFLSSSSWLCACVCANTTDIERWSFQKSMGPDGYGRQREERDFYDLFARHFAQESNISLHGREKKKKM